MAILRTYAEVLELEPNEAEQDLITKCQAGELCVRGYDVPSEPSDGRTIRADILRYLLLGGCKDCVVDSRGLGLVGGFITGTLDINYAKVDGATQLENCHFQDRFDSVQTQFRMVDLTGSTLKGWFAQGAKVESIVFLRNITASATINLNSASIGGQLDCTGAQITTEDEYAIAAPNARISGGVFLNPRTKRHKDQVKTHFHATGELRFNGAILGGFYAQQATLVATASGQSLSLGGTIVNGAVRLDGCDSTGEILLAGSRISGRLTCERIKIRNDKGHAFNGQAMRIEHSFVWKKVEHISGAVSLNGAHVAELNDDPENWPGTDDLFLDGFTYDRIKGTVSTSPARMGWLENGSIFDREFRPQPYSQYAKFLRAVGHDADARNVLEQGEELARADQRRRRLDPNETQGLNDLQWKLNTAWNALDRTVFDPAFKWVIGYGHAPFRALNGLLILILLCFIPTFIAYHKGQFAPNSAVILESSGWNDPSIQEAQNPAAEWSNKTGKGRDWESFSAGAYAVDVVIPIINFGQTDAWAPSTTRGAWGYHLWWARWVFNVLGWLVTALGAAAITGIIRRE